MLTDTDKEIILIMNKNTWLEDLSYDLARYRAVYDEKYNLKDLLKWVDRLQTQIQIELKREEENAEKKNSGR